MRSELGYRPDEKVCIVTVGGSGVGGRHLAAPEIIAAAIAEEIDRPVLYRPVETDGAARAARRIAELL